MRTEEVILGQLVKEETFARRVLPYLRPEYFLVPSDRQIYELISGFYERYNSPPSFTALDVGVDNLKIEEGIHAASKQMLRELKDGEKVDQQWMLDTTEEFCKQQSLSLAIMASMDIIEGKDKKRFRDAIPGIVQEALAVGFDSRVGHDYFADAEARYEFYHRKEARIPFDIELLNMATRGGPPRKTLNLIIGDTNIGKTLAMCSMATANLRAGFNVLYITAEIAEEWIGERIDQNLTDVSTEELEVMGKQEFLRRVAKAKEGCKGRLIIKEYPTSQANVNHFRALLRELQIKQNFKPDVVYVDYLNICAAARYGKGANVKGYEIVKAIAEELRGLATEFGFCCWSATQTNREGFGSSDIDMDATAESFGVPQTADFMMALISSEELERLGQYMAKVLKNRYNKRGRVRRFAMGVDYDKMRLFNVEQRAQAGIAGAAQVQSPNTVRTAPGTPFQQTMPAGPFTRSTRSAINPDRFVNFNFGPPAGQLDRAPG